MVEGIVLVLGGLLLNKNTLLDVQGKHAEAEPLYKQSHAIREKSLVQEDSDGAEVLTNRAFLLKEQVRTRRNLQ